MEKFVHHFFTWREHLMVIAVGGMVVTVFGNVVMRFGFISSILVSASP